MPARLPCWWFDSLYLETMHGCQTSVSDACADQVTLTPRSVCGRRLVSCSQLCAVAISCVQGLHSPSLVLWGVPRQPACNVIALLHAHAHFSAPKSAVLPVPVCTGPQAGTFAGTARKRASLFHLTPRISMRWDPHKSRHDGSLAVLCTSSPFRAQLPP
jgi:hypothetical protein